MNTDADVDMDAGTEHRAHEEVDPATTEEARDAGETKSVAQKVSEAMWGLLKPTLPEDSPFRGYKEPPELDVEEAELQRSKDYPEPLFGYVLSRILDAYDELGIKYAVLRGLRDDIVAKVTEILNAPKVAAVPEGVEKAFTVTYSGDANKKFQQYLVRCCSRYKKSPVDYTAPYVTIMQSSGFGKSRILYELAKNLAWPSQDIPVLELDMRLLYVCARTVDRSSGFPVATPRLTSFFFGDEPTADHLIVSLEYACANWDAVKYDWIQLFGVDPRDGKACAVAASHANVTSHGSVNEPAVTEQQASSAKKASALDAALTSALTSALDLTLKARVAREAGSREPSPTKSRRSSDSSEKDEQVKVLVLAIDEARSLLERKQGKDTNSFHLLRRALKAANEALVEKERKAMIFAVLIDTNSQIHDFVPPLSKDLSSRRDKTTTTRLFPPFVLTHTMDVALNPPFDYKASVLQSTPAEAWATLVSMGRPLWHSHSASTVGKDPLRAVLFLAGSKLLCGLEPHLKSSYRADTLNGVAALLCRLGLRPQSSSALASKVVADFMAVLHYVSYTFEAHISGYLTEPVLAFAATHLWYETSGLPLQEFMLPQFQELVIQGVIDVGGIGEVVARIVLLLAMDKVITSAEPGEFALTDGGNLFTGQFCSVKRFLGLLDGSFKPLAESDAVDKPREQASGSSQPKLFNVVMKEEKNETTGDLIGQTEMETGTKMKRSRTTRAGDTGKTSMEHFKKTGKRVIELTDDATPEQKASFESWMDAWDDWSVGFSHFVELTAVPTEATLWFLLGRRAAGVFPRGQKGADLIIPIFCKSSSEVSFMLVQVKNKDRADSEFPQSALDKLTPASVFQVNKKHSRHELSEYSPRRVIRIFMSLRESNMNKPAQSYLIDKTENAQVADESYSLCLRGMCRLRTRGSASPLAYWPFLQSQEVSDQLAQLADSAWWDPLARVKADLARRSKVELADALKKDLPDEELEEGVEFTLELVPYAKTSEGADVEMKPAAGS